MNKLNATFYIRRMLKAKTLSELVKINGDFMWFLNNRSDILITEYINKYRIKR